MSISKDRVNIAHNQVLLYMRKYFNPVATKAQVFRELNIKLHEKRKINPATLSDFENVLADLDGEIMGLEFVKESRS